MMLQLRARETLWASHRSKRDRAKSRTRNLLFAMYTIYIYAAVQLSAPRRDESDIRPTLYFTLLRPGTRISTSIWQAETTTIHSAYICNGEKHVAAEHFCASHSPSRSTINASLLYPRAYIFRFSYLSSVCCRPRYPRHLTVS